MKHYNVLNEKFRNKVIIFNDVSGRGIEYYEDQLETLTEDLQAIVAIADEEDRDLTEEESEDAKKIENSIEACKQQIRIRNTISRKAEKTESRGRKVRNSGTSIRVEPNIKPDNGGTYDFKNFGEFARTVALAGKKNEDAIQRFQNVASTYGSEINGPDGGYLIPADFGTELWKKVTGEGSLYSRCTEYITGSNSMVLPKDENTPWGTSGVQAVWLGEGQQGTETKPSFLTDSMRLNKLMCLINVTDELLEDAPGLDSYIRTNAPDVMTQEINSAIIDGNGVGKPLGILQATNSLLTLTKETSQDAATILFQNISKMYSRMYAPLRNNAVWLINQDIEPQLDQLAFTDPNGNIGGSQPLYMPVAGLQDSPNARLKSRPVLPFQACKTLGTSGDIILVDLSQYIVLAKAGGIRTETSMHLHFDQDMMTYKLTFRMTGKPRWSSTITPQNGSNTLGYAVVMEDRD